MKLTAAFLASLTAVSLFAQSAPNARAQDSTPAPSPEATLKATQGGTLLGTKVVPIIAQFFTALEHDDIDKAYTALTAGSNIANQTKGLDTLKTKTADAIKAFGEIRGYDIVGTKWIGTHLVRVTCISLGATNPLRWRFYFYNGANGWKLVDIGMNARLSQIFEEAEDTTPAVTN